MYICENCKGLFDEPRAVRDFVGYRGDEPMSQMLYCCPHCGSDSIDEARLCTICGDLKGERDVRDGICFCCIDRVKEAFDTLVSKEFTEDEKRALSLLEEDEPLVG